MQIKYSKQRETLLELLKSVKSHPDANWLYTELRKTLPNISLGTVYRNLSQLYEQGRILKLDVGSGTEHFDGNNNIHYHFVCSYCGSILDIDIDYIEEIDETANNKLNVEIENHSLIFFGKCQNCI